MDDADHLVELAEQCREKAKKTPPSFTRMKHLRRAEHLEQMARERGEAHLTAAIGDGCSLEGQ